MIDILVKLLYLLLVIHRLPFQFIELLVLSFQLHQQAFGALLLQLEVSPQVV